MGNLLLKILIAEYFIIALFYLIFDKNYAKAIYFTGAIILSVGVLLAK